MNDRNLRLPIKFASAEVARNKLAYYRWLREEAPVYRARLAMLRVWMVSRYEDCDALLKDDRFVRNRTTATGGGPLPFPLPKSVALLMHSMILEDDPEHRRLRGLVHQAFSPRRLKQLEGRIESLAHELIDRMDPDRPVDLMAAYARPIPTTVIGEMVGVEQDEIPQLTGYIDSLSSGFSGWKLLRTFLWDLPEAVAYMRGLIERKRRDPGEDILTDLIHAEEDGDRLSEDELISMVFLLIVAGHETTVHLISNAIQALLAHPDQLDRLKRDPGLLESTVEEALRFNGPIHATKMNYALEPITLHGVTIPKGAAVMPLLGAANHDPEAFPDASVFDIGREPNRHLGFGQGRHFCLGAPLARMETRIALAALLERWPDFRLTVDPGGLEVQPFPGWHRYKSMELLLR